MRYQRVRRQRRALDRRIEELRRAEDTLRRAAGEIQPSDLGRDDFSDDDDGVAEVLKLLLDAVANQVGYGNRLRDLADEMGAYRSGWEKRVAQSSWAAGERSAGDAYQELEERLAQEGVEDLSAYGPLVQRRYVLEKRLTDLDALVKQMQELEEKSGRVRRRIDEQRAELSRRRTEFLESVLSDNQFVRIGVVEFGGDLLAVEAGLRESLDRKDGALAKDFFVEEDDRGIVADLYRDLPGGTDRVAEFRGRLQKVKSDIAEIADGGEAGGYTKWFRNHVQGLRPEQIDRLMLWYPEDELHVEYRRAGASPFIPIKQGSPGQKSAAILAFLLSYGDEPVILDQPEDDLDNHLIYDLVVAQLRDNKRRRQVIVATHNPNIVVNGDAEMVISMNYQQGQCVVVDDGTGSLQGSGVRKEVCRIMEGGRRAFESRYRRLVTSSGGV